MKYLKNFFESTRYDVSDIRYDVSDILLELEDEGFYIIKNYDMHDDYAFSDEFCIVKKGDSGYYVGDYEISLYNINEVLDTIYRFKDIIELNNLKIRVLVHDGEFLVDISEALNQEERLKNRIFTPKDSEVLLKTHLHFKNRTNKKGLIDLENLKFVSLQIMRRKPEFFFGTQKDLS
jgi:hypothetical protein